MGKKSLAGTIFISHPHWDHINFFPFFAPLFVPGNEFTVVGSPVDGLTIKDLVAHQMDGIYFPITPREFGAQLIYRDVGEGRYAFGPAQVETMLLCHPGNCLGYAVTYGGRKLCYLTDNEMFPQDSRLFSQSYRRRIIEFVADADILITDATYTDAEYPAKIGWGHSRLSEVCEFAHAASVKKLYLFHHDPDQDDDALELKLATATSQLEKVGSSTQACLATAEQEVSF